MQEGEQKPRQSCVVILTSDHPAASFAIAPETIKRAPPVIDIHVTKVENPERFRFQIFVYLSFRAGQGLKEFHRILIGNGGLFPADRPAGFLMRASTAFAKLNATAPGATDVYVLVEMRPLEKAGRLDSVEVTVAPPEWKRDAGR